MPNYTFLARFKPQIWSSWALKLKHNIHFTKTPKRDHIYKLCLYTLEEHNNGEKAKKPQFHIDQLKKMPEKKQIVHIFRLN